MNFFFEFSTPGPELHPVPPPPLRGPPGAVLLRRRAEPPGGPLGVAGGGGDQAAAAGLRPLDAGHGRLQLHGAGRWAIGFFSAKGENILGPCEVVILKDF